MEITIKVDNGERPEKGTCDLILEKVNGTVKENLSLTLEGVTVYLDSQDLIRSLEFLTGKK